MKYWAWGFAWESKIPLFTVTERPERLAVRIQQCYRVFPLWFSDLAFTFRNIGNFFHPLLPPLRRWSASLGGSSAVCLLHFCCWFGFLRTHLGVLRRHRSLQPIRTHGTSVRVTKASDLFPQPRWTPILFSAGCCGRDKQAGKMCEREGKVKLCRCAGTI